jgi:hypothetical protein
MKVHIIFSAFGKPSDFPVLQSIEKYSGIFPICLTSRSYGESWRTKGVETHQTFFNPMSKLSKIFRFLIRKRLFLINYFLPKFILNFRFLRNIFVVPHNLRHFLALEVLNKIDPEDYVFLVDSRDLIFQSSPIDIVRILDTEDKIHVFDEGLNYFRNNLPQNFIYSKANFEWVQKLLNCPKDFSLFDLKNSVINSGCIAGSAKNIRKLLSLTTALISQSRYGVEALLDQAALNVAVYGNHISDSYFKVNANGTIVLNMCGVIKESTKIVNGKLLVDNKLTPIVHQFDRFGIYSVEDELVLNRRNYQLN